MQSNCEIKVLTQAQKSLSAISANRDLWIAQYRQEVRERDYRSGLSAARREGMREMALETAKKMLADGIPTAQIAKWLGLSPKELASL